MSDTMFNLLDTVEDDDLIQVTPVRGASDPAKLGSATDGKYFARKSQIGGDGAVSDVSGSDNITVDPTTGNVVVTLNTNLIQMSVVHGVDGDGLTLQAETNSPAVDVDGADITISTKPALGTGNAGNVRLDPGTAGGSGTDGDVRVNGTPVFDNTGHLLQPDDALININSITAADGNTIAVTAGSAENDTQGPNAALSASDGGDSTAGGGQQGGDALATAGDGSPAFDGDTDGGAGGNVILRPGGGGDGSGAGNPGADGDVRVRSVPVFDRDGNLIAPAAHLSSAGSADFPSLTIGSLITAGWYSPSAGQFAWATSGVTSFNFLVNRFRCGSDVTVGFANDPDVTVGSIDTEFLRVQAGIISVTKGLQTIPGTVAALPAATAGNTGARAFVTDANTSIILGLGLTVIGGGANKVPVYSDGTNWLIG